jgi:hypothetical protein
MTSSSHVVRMIVPIRSEYQVIRSYTQFHVADMPHHHASRNWAMRDLVGNAMCEDGMPAVPAANVYFPVASTCSRLANPQPAAGGLYHLAPKTLLNWHPQASKTAVFAAASACLYSLDTEGLAARRTRALNTVRPAIPRAPATAAILDLTRPHGEFLTTVDAYSQHARLSCRGTRARTVFPSSSSKAMTGGLKRPAAALADNRRSLSGHRWHTPSVSGPRRLNHARGPLGLVQYAAPGLRTC